MTDITLHKHLLSYSGVTRFDLKAQQLRRYRLHDAPFAVLDADNVLHLRLQRARVYELLARYPSAFSPSNFYDSRHWVMTSLDSGLEDAVIFRAIDWAVERIIQTLPSLARIIYTEKNPIFYNMNFQRALEPCKPLFVIDEKVTDKK